MPAGGQFSPQAGSPTGYKIKVTKDPTNRFTDRGENYIRYRPMTAALQQLYEKFAEAGKIKPEYETKVNAGKIPQLTINLIPYFPVPEKRRRRHDDDHLSTVQAFLREAL